MVLEDVALDAVIEDGRLVARTSARRLAEQLGIDPGTAANALQQLRRRGLLGLEREPGPAGRFGLALYVLGDVEGLAVIAPSGTGPYMAQPDTEQPCGVDPDMAPTDVEDMSTAARSSRRPDRAAAAPDQRGRAPLTVAADQGTLDLTVESR
jgi:DNA-binding transcriptional MocR family regulator